jgi:hypothetical protein
MSQAVRVTASDAANAPFASGFMALAFAPLQEILEQRLFRR